MRDPYDPYAGAPPPPPPMHAPESIADCGLCDADGYRGSTICDHIDHAPAARRGIEACRQAIRRRPANPADHRKDDA